MRTEPLAPWDLTSAKVDRIEAISVGLRRCSSSPVNVRMKKLPRFSKVHMVVFVRGRSGGVGGVRRFDQ